MPRTDDSPGKRHARAPSGKFLTREDITKTIGESVRKTGITADRVKSIPDIDDDVEEGSVERKQSAGGYVDYDRQEEAGEDEDVDYIAREETREEE